MRFHKNLVNYSVTPPLSCAKKHTHTHARTHAHTVKIRGDNPPVLLQCHLWLNKQSFIFCCITWEHPPGPSHSLMVQSDLWSKSKTHTRQKINSSSLVEEKQKQCRLSINDTILPEARDIFGNREQIQTAQGAVHLSLHNSMMLDKETVESRKEEEEWLAANISWCETPSVSKLCFPES